MNQRKRIVINTGKPLTPFEEEQLFIRSPKYVFMKQQKTLEEVAIQITEEG